MAVLHGINTVIETIKASPERVERVCVERGSKNPRIQEIIDLARQNHVRVSFEERSWLDRQTGGAKHQGALCLAAEIPLRDAEEIVAQARKPGLLVILDGIEDPHNLGAILRSAEAAGADGVILPQHRSAAVTATVVKASAGAASHIKLARVTNVARFIETLKSRSYWVVGLDTAGNTPVWELDLTVPTALVLGSEGGGLHKLVKEKCDFLASLPIRGAVGSYNVSVAAGIALYEALRQRAPKKTR